MKVDQFNFRYYDEDHHKMYYSNDSVYDVISFFENVEIFAKNMDIMPSYFNYKDRNNQLIYEGDLLGTYSTKNQKCDLWTLKEYGITEVKINNKTKQFYTINWCPEFDNIDSIFYKKFIVVVGNRYEGIYDKYKGELYT